MLLDLSEGPHRFFCTILQFVYGINLISLFYINLYKVDLLNIFMLINILDLSFIWTSFSFFGGSIVFKDTYIGIWNMIQMLIISTINLITFTYIIIKFFKNINIYLKYENKDETNL
tara:strand:- start:103 stop:450 length:348 start_codon:yes stop_codon:yes gene_type:complete